MKLKCMRHCKRVVVVEVPNALLGPKYGEVRTLHREDGSVCKATTLKIGDTLFTPTQILAPRGDHE